ncbi:hypothetical protein A9320_25655 [Ruegeria sp. PBVC088]|nr:hypothetical protein A9320_25655 [Ruegeria sp. PBVC088]
MTTGEIVFFLDFGPFFCLLLLVGWAGHREDRRRGRSKDTTISGANVAAPAIATRHDTGADCGGVDCG